MHGGRAAPSDACLPVGSSLDVIGDRGSLVNDNDPLINSWGLCLIVIRYGIQGSLAIKKASTLPSLLAQDLLKPTYF